MSEGTGYDTHGDGMADETDVDADGTVDGEDDDGDGDGMIPAFEPEPSLVVLRISAAEPLRLTGAQLTDADANIGDDVLDQ